MSNHPNRGRRRHGHLPGHIRDTFLQAIEAYGELPEGRKLPRVLHQVRYRDRTVSIDEACGLVWSCTDVMPDSELRNLGDWGVMDYPPATRTYAAAARALLADVRARYGVDAGFDARMKRLYDERDRLWDALETVIAGERDFDLSSELGRGQAVVYFLREVSTR